MSVASVLPEGYPELKRPIMSDRSVLFISSENAPAARIEAVVTDALSRGESTTRLAWSRVEALFDGLRALQETVLRPLYILSDLFLPDGQGLATLRHLQQHAPQTPVIVFCHSQDRDTAVTSVRKGAYDFFCYEDLDTASLRRSRLEAALQHANSGSGEENGVGAAQQYALPLPAGRQLSVAGASDSLGAGNQRDAEHQQQAGHSFYQQREISRRAAIVQVSLDWPARLGKSGSAEAGGRGPHCSAPAGGQTAMTHREVRIPARAARQRSPRLRRMR